MTTTTTNFRPDSRTLLHAVLAAGGVWLLWKLARTARGVFWTLFGLAMAAFWIGFGLW